MNTYIRTLKDKFGNLIFPRTRTDAVFTMDNTTKLNEKLDAMDTNIAGKAPALGADDNYMTDAEKLKLAGIANNANNYSLPTASTTVLGGVKVDGTSITITNGVISTNADDLNATALGSVVNGATAKTTPVDADNVMITDSAASHIAKKVTWLNVKATLKTYFDTLYNMYTHPTGDGNLHVPANSTTNNNRVLKADSTAGSYAWTDLGTVANGLTAKATPIDADSIMVVDSAASNVGKKTTIAELKAILLTYFNTIFAKKYEYTATIPSASWTGASAPYSKAVTVSGLLSTDKPTIDLVLSGTYATDTTMRENWAKIYRGVTSANTITFYADSVPSADINIQLVGVR